MANVQVLTGEASFKPWSGYWWPLTEGALVFGYNGSPSPLGKYDYYTQGVAPALASAWEQVNHYTPGGISWAGYCHAWANASILEDIQFKTSTHKGIFFAVGDKKGLMTLAHADDPQIVAYVSDDPSVFHRYLLEYVGENKMAVAADLDNSEAFWSYPIYRYTMTLTQTTEFDDVQCTIFYADDFVAPDFEGTKELPEYYEYRLYKDAQGSYTHGQWTGWSIELHPELVWVPVSQGAENPNIEYQTIMEIANATDDENEGVSEILPGHHAIIVSPGESDAFDIVCDGTLDLSFALDRQTPRGTLASYKLFQGGLERASGTITGESAGVSLDCTGKAQLIIYPDENNASDVFVHLYLDVTMAENCYFLNVPNNRYWMGMALANQDETLVNDLFVTFMSQNGTPLAGVGVKNSLDKASNWSGILDKNANIDYFSQGTPSLVKISSRYPLDLLMLNGNGDALSSTPRSNKGSGTPRKLIIPLLTQTFNMTQSASLFLFNPGEDDLNQAIEYYYDNGIPFDTTRIDLPSKGSRSFSSGDYPGSVNFNGWGMIEDVSGQLTGTIEVNERVGKSDRLPLLETAQDFFIPGLCAVGGWETELVLINPEETAVDLSLEAIDGSTLSRILISVPGHGRQIIALNSVTLGVDDQRLSDSWLQVTASHPIAGYFRYGYNQVSNALFPLFTDKALSVSKRLGHTASDNDWWTGVNLVNPHNWTIAVDVVGFDSAGVKVGSRQMEINPLEKVVKTVADLFPNVQANSLTFYATAPIAGLALYGTREKVELLSGKIFD
ncbi:hypothetical protein HRM2_30030 [Desulforapulum autotrophicum HRM2]|uniref:Uncharacterized protein n=1 Tax=Desulforapulum autotrophicum (strain ATCC 43914 / DSM 3382 / VKM B-1955 / HRM2) TaxID=177437 RepID=C0QK60_DESAH|nr:hypothetical protein [Desulforapulum autotrophicum]ACN16086.1 hypothetical protein HRM2_30030 [Desulforapulum autotrophicum HRM2]